MVGRLDRKPSADPLAITRAMLEGALHKANDAVHADRMQDWDYAMQSYGDSCALLGRCMERTNQTDEEGALHWQIMEGIRNSYVRRIYDIRDAHRPRTPHSRSQSRSRPRTPNNNNNNNNNKSVINSQRSSTWVKTPPRTPRQLATPPRTPKLAPATGGPPSHTHLGGAIQMQEQRSISVWSAD